MAITVSTSQNEVLRSLSRRFGFDDIRVEPEMNSNMLTFILTRGDEVTAIRVDRSAPPSLIFNELQKKAGELTPTNIIDLRSNAIESMDDVQYFINKAREQGRKTDTIEMLPDQVAAIQTKVPGGRPSIDTSRLFGHRLEVRPR